MAEYPSLPLFTDAFISDTTHLTAAQTGAYIMLLMHAWRSRDCALPDDDRILARMARMDGRLWAAHKEVILSFWHLSDINGVQKWVQRRLLDERNFVAATRTKNVLAGRASALKRKERGSTSVQPEFNPHTHTHTHTYIDNTNVLSTKNMKKVKPDATSKTRISDDWRPDEKNIERCRRHNLGLENTVDAFVGYWLGKGEKRADWQACFRQWVANQVRYAKERAPNKTEKPTGRPIY